MREIERIEVGEPFFIKNLLLYPLYFENGSKFNPFSLDEALNNKIVRIEEVNGGKINEVIFKNLSNERVFAIDGEEIIGALQNRVINTAFLAEEKTEFLLPVTCVEEGRWSGNKKEFSSGEMSFVTIRSVLCKTVNKSLYEKKKFEANQSIVWEKVRETLKSLKVNSKTLSMHDTYNQCKDEIEKYIEDLNFNSANGLIAFAGKDFLCMDFFNSKNLFNKYKLKILKGYAIDALSRRNETTNIRKKEEIEEIIHEIKNSKKDKFKSISLGNEIRFETKNFVGRALEYNDEILHLAVFKK
ncbi:MAG: DUF6569 family protein [candidate division WOR-3 bacterium]